MEFNGLCPQVERENCLLSFRLVNFAFSLFLTLLISFKMLIKKSAMYNKFNGKDSHEMKSLCFDSVR